MQQKILPVISDHKSFEKFLNSDLTWCILMDFHINFIQDLFIRMHKYHKKGIVHMDLIHGIANDAFGVQFMIQTCKIDGIISTKPKAMEEAKKQHVLAILRVFLIDSRSLKKSALLAEKLQPDYIEILPGIVPNAVELIREYTHLSIIGGGLIRTQAQVDGCLNQGMIAITTSTRSLWE